jgi:hypothetical protein
MPLSFALLAVPAPEVLTSLLAKQATPRVWQNATRACLKLFETHAENLLVLPKDGLIWCPVPKVGTTTMVSLLARRFNEYAAVNELVNVLHIHAAGSRGGSGSLPETHRVQEQLPLALRHLIKIGSQLSEKAREELCSSGRAVSFTAVRNPWNRLVSAYLGKIAIHRGHESDELRGFYGLGEDDDITFEQFVLWLKTQSDDVVYHHANSHYGINPHWEGQVHRCGADAGAYSIVASVDGGGGLLAQGRLQFGDYVKQLLRQLGWDDALYEEDHISSLASCLKPKNSKCVDALELQLGPKAGWANESSSSLARKLFAARSHSDGQSLVEVVRKRYRLDVDAFGYEYDG